MSLRLRVYPPASWLFAMMLAAIALPVCAAVAQEGGEKPIPTSSEEDPAAAQDDPALAREALPPVPSAPPTPPAPTKPRRPAKVENADNASDPWAAAKVAAAEHKARALQEVMKALKQQQDQMAKQQAVIGKQLQELSKGTGEPMHFEWNLGEVEQKKNLDALDLAGTNIIANAQGTPFKITAPLPANAVLRAFKLQYVKPEEIGQALHNITGGGGPRIAIDERTNALLIAGEDKQMGVVQQVIEALDQPAGQKDGGIDTLQVRVVWVLDTDSDEGKAAEMPYVSSQVVDGLRELGFKSPRVMCQQVTTLTFGREREGRMQFQIPVLAEGSAWQFDGDARVTPANDDRYSIQFTLGLRQPNNPHNCQVGGSILTPLDHYTVMGTSTFVATTPSEEKESEVQPALNQQLSAFVVYVDRAPVFGE